MAGKSGMKYLNSCLGKRKYLTMPEAMARAKERNQPQLGAYKCKFCSAWHLGHTPKGFKPPLCHDDVDY